LDEFLNEYEMFDGVFKDIGDISGLTVLDAGPEGVASRYLAGRIGQGRIIGVNVWLEAYNMVRKRVGDELMSKVVFIKDDMAQMDYLKDDFFDLVFSYDTLVSIEAMTPGGTLPILTQFYRVLKPDGWFLAVEHPALEEVKPINKAQELELIFRRILDQIQRREFGKGTYTPRQLSEMLRSIGFTNIYWKTASEGIYAMPSEVTEMVKGLLNLAKERIRDEEERIDVLEQIQNLSSQAKKIGFCEPPYYALYAWKLKEEKCQKRLHHFRPARMKTSCTSCIEDLRIEGQTDDH